MEIPRIDPDAIDEAPAFVEPPRLLFVNPHALDAGWIWDPTTEEGWTCAVAGDGRVSEISEGNVGRPPADWLPWTRPDDAEPETEPDDTARDTLATKMLDLSDIAERDCTAEQLAAARQEFREWMRNHGQGKPLEALAIRLKEMGPATIKARGLVVHGCKAVLEEGRADRADVPTMDAPSGDVGGKKGERPKGAKSSTGPKKSKRSTAWAKRLGQSAVGFQCAFSPDDARLLETIKAGSFARRPEEILSAPEYGFCPVDDPSIGTAEMTALPGVGSDPEWVLWGLRRDAKTGCPTHHFRYEAEHTATAEALAKGYANASGARIKEIQDGLVTAWYRTATPQTTVVPCAWHRPTMRLYVFSENAEAVSQAQARASKTLGGLERIPSRLQAVPAADIDKLSRTSLRHEDAEAIGRADLAADVLLWLVGRQLGGTGVVTLADGGRLEWWADDAVELDRAGADEKKLRVKLGGAPAEGGSLAAALADGATLQSVRLALRIDEQTWKVTLAGGAPRGWKLPVLTKPDGTPAGLDSAVDERLRLWRRGEQLLLVLLEAALGDRFDRSTWRQRISTLRQLLGVEIVRRWGFDPATKMGVLFPHMLAAAGGEQQTLGSVVVEDKRKKSRAERAAEAAAGPS